MKVLRIIAKEGEVPRARASTVLKKSSLAEGTRRGES